MRLKLIQSYGSLNIDMGAEEQGKTGVTLPACISLSIKTSSLFPLKHFDTVLESAKGMSAFLEL
jgi:hypothetical protein